MSALFPEEQPEGLQMWPIGHGVVVSTVAVVGNNGMFIMAGVPDALRGVPGQEMDGDPLEIIQSLMAVPHNQSCVMVYPSAEHIDQTIAQLTDLKQMMAGDAA